MIAWTSCLLLLMAGGMVGCSSNDKDESGNPMVGVDFRLLNENGEPSTTFNYGDDICFDLVVDNRSDSPLAIGANSGADTGPNIVLGKDLFKVYSEQGEYVGVPWTSIGASYVFVAISPKETAHLSCHWMAQKAQRPIEKNAQAEPLPRGKYYTQFEVTLYGSQKVKCRKEFSVR